MIETIKNIEIEAEKIDGKLRRITIDYWGKYWQATVEKIVNNKGLVVFSDHDITFEQAAARLIVKLKNNENINETFFNALYAKVKILQPSP